MPASIVDGNDVLAVREAVAGAVVRARAGEGPAFMECKTVRWQRHSAFSAGGADPVEQRRRWQRVDPIPRYRASLLAWGVADEAAIGRVDSSAVEEMAAVRTEAEAAPHPGPESVWDDIYAPARH